MKKSKLSEGMRENDLLDLILPMISIDEYESKISKDEDVIVVGFFIDDEEPAQDLASFIDRSVIEILDTDVSPAPTEEGYFLVFVELYRNKEFPENLLKIVSEVEKLAEIKNWDFKAYRMKEPKDLNKENLVRYVRIDDITQENFEIRNYLKGSMLDDISFHNDYIILEKKNVRNTFKIIGLRDTKETLNSLKESIDFKDIATANRIRGNLGPKWNVWMSSNYCVLTSQSQSEKSLVLKIT